MNRRIFWIVLLALGLPVVLRVLWYFPGFVLPRSVATPDYVALKMPEPPLSTPAAALAKQTSGTVLIDYAHDNQLQLSEIQSLTDAITHRGGHFVVNADVHTLAAQLTAVNSYVVISPSESFTPAEIALVEAFVGRGGRLLVFTDATRGLIAYDFFGNPTANQPDIVAVNPLLEPFGITVNADYLYDLESNEGNFRNVFLNASPGSDLTNGLSRVAFYGAHSLSVLSGSALLTGGGTTFSSSTDAVPEDQSQKGWAGAVVDNDGTVMALGDFTFLSSPYSAVADNAVLISNLADFLLATPRQPALADFPYLFGQGPVSVLATSDVQITAEMTGALSGLQTEFSTAAMPLTVVQKAPSKGGLIVLGTFSPSDDLKPFVKPFGLEADLYGEYVRLPPFGKIGQSGNALMLFRTGDDGNTLVLLASSIDDLTSLLKLLGTADLSDCLLQGNVAACSVGFGGSFSESTPTPTLVPDLLTPTAGG